MGWFISRVLSPLVGYRRRAMRNLAFIYPELDQSQRRNLANAVTNNAGRALMENYSGEEFRAHLKNTKTVGEGLPAVLQAQKDNRPVMFVTGHFGNHDAARYVLNDLGLSIGGLYRPMSNPFFNEHYVETLANVSGPIFARGRKGIIGFSKHLKSGGMAVLFFDVAMTEAEKIPFMGQPAYTALSAAEFALKYDALMVPYFAIRKSDGLNFEILVDAPIPHSTPIEMMTEATKRLEAQIINRPEQWFWVHRRWKGVL